MGSLIPTRVAGGLIAGLLLSLVLACGDGQNGGQDPPPEPDVDSNLGSVRGSLAAPAGVPPAEQSKASPNKSAPPPNGLATKSLSFDQVSIDLLQVLSDAPPADWPIVSSVVPDSLGAFAFDGLSEGIYSLVVNQPEFASVAYAVDSTEFFVAAGQTVSIVLPLITTLAHGLVGPNATLDLITGEVVLLSDHGVAIVDSDRGTIDLLFSRNLFHGRSVLALAPVGQVIWVLFADRIVRIDRSLFSDPEVSESYNLDDVDGRLAVGDKVSVRTLAAPPGYGGCFFSGATYFSPDEQMLYASTYESGVMVIDLATMSIVRVIVGRLIGYNPVANRLFFSNGPPYAQQSGNSGTEILVVDASTRLEVAVIALENVRGVAPIPGSPETLMVGSKLSTAEAQIPFIKIVDAAGTLLVDMRARDYLGLTYDPPAGPPSFDVTGEYFILGSSAFKVLAGGGFEPMPTAVAPGSYFNQRVEQHNHQRAIDPVHLYEIWYGSGMENASIGLFSLNQTNLPVAVRPGVGVSELLLDQTRGRAIFWGADKLVFVHYSDPGASEREELTDLSSMVAPFLPAFAACSASNPCSAADTICLGATDTAYLGWCLPNPRLPYRVFCGGFFQESCDGGFTCKLLNATNPNSTGYCGGFDSLVAQNYGAHGPHCGEGSPCPLGMRCGATNRCEPKGCGGDSDCQTDTGEVCGQIAFLGRVCLASGNLPDNAFCLRPDDCQSGTCVPIAAAYSVAVLELLDGNLGTQVCSSSCLSNSDCPEAGQCLQMSFPGAPDYHAAETIWRTHHQLSKPFCQPSALRSIVECEGVCNGDQKCTTNSYLTPAVCSGGSPCGGSCADDENCAVIGSGNLAGVCVTGAACAGDFDCDNRPGACRAIYSPDPMQWEGACLDACATNADCSGGDECVETGPIPGTELFCLPAQCGCSGPDAGAMVCSLASLTCVVS